MIIKIVVSRETIPCLLFIYIVYIVTILRVKWAITDNYIWLMGVNWPIPGKLGSTVFKAHWGSIPQGFLNSTCGILLLGNIQHTCKHFFPSLNSPQEYKLQERNNLMCLIQYLAQCMACNSAKYLINKVFIAKYPASVWCKKQEKSR